ncbi:DNA polymerase domain-containing protein [Gordonia sp. (in: high G+C Gram-positive bacteria)]|uniref:DNA polymerase domain-containing protein n=1 Tax=Gordonia sp. (in: high G+C Gram-positive bacteria) TaxID=84139 RepID=UPI0039E63D93
MAPSGKAPAIEVDVDGVPVRLSSPDKPFFPELGDEAGCKKALFDYCVAMAGTAAEPGPLLRALHRRPTFLQRFPDGITGDEVYQKHLPRKHPDYLHETLIEFPSKRTGHALCPTIPADLAWAAQMGTVTFHSWPTVDGGEEDPNNHPDQLRIDLDPPDGRDFDEVRGVALDVVKPVLDELALPGFVKTSGSRGIHVFIPIRPQWGFIATRRAAIALGREMERRAPDRITMSWWKEERGERVFIDYNQNARDRSMASAYSVRRSPTARVSTPVTWAELVDVDPQDLTMATVPGLIAERGDPWAQMTAAAVGVEPLLEMVARDDADGLGDLPYPPSFPKMPGEPPRVQPSRKVPEHWDQWGNPRPKA